MTPPGAETIEEIERSGGKARFLAADLSDPAEIDARRGPETSTSWSTTPGTQHGGDRGPDVATFDGMFADNVRAPFYLVAAFAPAMAARGTGSIINISSMAGRLGLAGGAAYGATKAALVSMTQAWTAEFSPRGVRVNAVAPGPVYTRPEARDLFDKLGTTTPLHRAAEPRNCRGCRIPRLAPRQLRDRRVVAVDGGRTAI